MNTREIVIYWLNVEIAAVESSLSRCSLPRNDVKADGFFRYVTLSAPKLRGRLELSPEGLFFMS